MGGDMQLCGVPPFPLQKIKKQTFLWIKLDFYRFAGYNRSITRNRPKEQYTEEFL